MDVCPRPWQSSGASLNKQTKESVPVGQEVKPSPWNSVSVQGHGSGGEGPAQQGSKKVQDLALVYEQVKGGF